MLLFFCSAPGAFSQQKEDRLFDEKKPLDITLQVSIDQIRESKADSTDVPGVLFYKNDKETFDSVKVNFRSRGNFRLNECYFPPTNIKFKSTDSKGSLFEGTKKIKLVLPCQPQGDGATLILKEYLCYKLYQVITPYALKARLVNIDFTSKLKKNDKQFKLRGIILEDGDKLAKRFDSKIAENVTASPNALQDTADLKMSFFQFMISNTDWSSAYQHNIELIQPKTGRFIPVAYDFDMSGLVDAPYAVVSQAGNEQLPVNSVRDRVYRGWCRAEDVTQLIRQEFLAKEAELMAVPDEIKQDLPEKTYKEVKQYLQSFFAILKDDIQFKKKMMGDCRK